MSEQFGNCKMQRKIDGKIIFAKKVGEDIYCHKTMRMLPLAKYYSDDDTELVRSSWREIEHEDDYESALVPIDDGVWDRLGYMTACAVLLFGICKFFGAI